MVNEFVDTLVGSSLDVLSYEFFDFGTKVDFHGHSLID